MRTIHKMLLLGGGTTYADIVRGIAPANLIQYLPMDETSGTTANDRSGNNRNAAYTGVALDSIDFIKGGRAGLWDGSADYVNTTGAALTGFAGAFNGQEGSFEGWFRVASAGVWTDATRRDFWLSSVSGANAHIFRKSTTNNALEFVYIAGGVSRTATISAVSSTDWIHLAATWSLAADQFIVYLNGSAVGSPTTGLGTYAGTIGTHIIGASNTTPSNVTSGYLAHFAWWNTPLTPTQVATLAA